MVGIGVAAAALDEFKKLAPGKASITGGAEIAQRPVTNMNFPVRSRISGCPNLVLSDYGCGMEGSK